MIKLGQRLRERRLEKGLTLEDVTRATKIRQSFLSAIEKGEYTKLPSSSYAQGFAVNYAEYLGLSKREALALFRREFDEGKAFKVLPDGFTESSELPFPRIKIRQSGLVLAFAFVLLFTFLGFSYRDAFLNPSLKVTLPSNTVYQTGEILVEGKTSPYATLTVNDLPVSLENDGSFRKILSLFPGKDTIVIKATNRFGRETVVMKEVEVKK